MIKIKHYQDRFGNEGYTFFCPACGYRHPFDIPRWNFNGDFENPTFTPSLRVIGGPTGTLCHLSITNGMIQYHGDCPHSYVGKTIPMVQLDE